MSVNQTLLVTGASGHLGRRVVELLLEAGAGSIVAATRAPHKLADFARRGVVVRQADFDDPASLNAAFAGVDRLLIISTDVADGTGRRIKQHVSAVQAAEQAGARHVVYTSLMNPGPESPVLLAVDHRQTEAALEASRLEWTVLRENIYTEVLLGALQQAVRLGRHFSAAGEGKTAYVTREDVARAAAVALASDFSGRRALDLTGPEALTQADVAALAAEITHQPVTYVPLTLEAAIQGMVNAGLPRPAAEAYASFDAGVAAGQFSGVSTAVEDLTGRKPTRAADFLTANRAALLPPAGVG